MSRPNYGKTAEELLGAALRQLRSDWLAENEPRDGTDCVTPFDVYLYGGPSVNHNSDKASKHPWRSIDDVWN
jgi:hypothetical protein